MTHSPSSPVITVSEAGEYKLDYTLNYSSGNGIQLGIAVNGILEYTLPTFTSTAGTVSGSTTLTLAAGDEITMRSNTASLLILEPAPAVGAQLDIY